MAMLLIIMFVCIAHRVLFDLGNLLSVTGNLSVCKVLTAIEVIQVRFSPDCVRSFPFI